ncbi:LysR family transcriptional regulator [Halomonas shantousis]
MDIDLARTFLEIVRTGSFIAAAERLHVTQTTVTARIHNLEAQLGCRLFVRNRSGARLTGNGQRFAGHASQLVNTWEAARRELPLPEGTEEMLSLGGEISLWNPLLLGWLRQLHPCNASLAVRAEVGERQTLHRRLEQGALDAILVHQPDYWPGIQVEQLLEEKLIMIRNPSAPEPYIYVDWGEAFRHQHDTALPHHTRASLSIDLGPLALEYLLEQGGSGYFRTRVALPFLQQGLLERVPHSPEFGYSVYLVYSRERSSALLEQAFAILRETAVDMKVWETTESSLHVSR